MEIEAVLKRIQDGDRQAYAAIVARYQRPLFGFLGRMALGQAMAEEIAQETFLRAWTNLADYRPGVALFSTWLFTIARNLALHELERAAHRREQSLPADGVEPACEGLRPPDMLERKQDRQRLHAALHRLSLPDRSVLALAYVQDLELAEVARIEQCSAGTIRTRLHRARERLRQILEEQNG